MKKGKNKKAQQMFGMSIGMIFTIILMVFFILIAIIAITALLSTQNCAKIGLYINDLETEIDNAWNQDTWTSEFKTNIPSGVKKVCFANTTNNDFKGIDRDLGIEIDIYPDKNMFFFPPNKACDMGEYEIEHLDIDFITRSNNPYCIQVNKGKIFFMIEKESDDRLVKIRK